MTTKLPVVLAALLSSTQLGPVQGLEYAATCRGPTATITIIKGLDTTRTPPGFGSRPLTQ